MPKIICSLCGKTYYGWALLYKKCYCDMCGTLLKIKGKEEIK